MSCRGLPYLARGRTPGNLKPKLLSKVEGKDSLYCASMSEMVLIETERATQASAGTGTALRDWVRALEATAPIAANPHRLLPDVIAEVAQTQADAPALLAAGESLTYGALAVRQNRYARWALGQGLAKGETVCLMMPNRPEYMPIWLGLSSVGVVVALINTQLRGPSLAHCIDIVAPKHVIVAAEFCAEFRAATALLSRPKIWSHGASSADADAFDRIDDAIEQFSGEPLNANRAPRSDRRGPRAADLHLRNDRPAKSRQCQPSSAPAMEFLVLRIDEHPPR